MMNDARAGKTVHFDRHAPEYRHEFADITDDLQARCPVAWTETHGGHWVASGYQAVFDIARNAEHVSSDFDAGNGRTGYHGISIPSMAAFKENRSGFIEMDPPEQREWRKALNPYLSPAAVARWRPFIQEITRACIDERVETGSIDFVDDLANIVPAVLTLGMMGLPLADWPIYCEPTHAIVYTLPMSPDMPRVLGLRDRMRRRLEESVAEIRATPRPGLVDALVTLRIDGESAAEQDVIGALDLVIGGGFDTTTALTAHTFEWLSENPGERARLSAERGRLLDVATEEFLRFYTPAPGDGRTIRGTCAMADNDFDEGDRVWLSWAMANRDPEVFPDPHRIVLDRENNRHTSFGLGVHRCIGSNVARQTFKAMLTNVLDRMPDFVCDPDRAEHYATIGIINGMQHLPATFTPGRRIGPGLDETLATLQRTVDEEGLAEPVTRQSRTAARAED